MNIFQKKNRLKKKKNEILVKKKRRLSLIGNTIYAKINDEREIHPTGMSISQSADPIVVTTVDSGIVCRPFEQYLRNIQHSYIRRLNL